MARRSIRKQMVGPDAYAGRDLTWPQRGPEKTKARRSEPKSLINMVGRIGFEPMTTALKVQCSTD